MRAGRVGQHQEAEDANGDPSDTVPVTALGLEQPWPDATYLWPKSQEEKCVTL